MTSEPRALSFACGHHWLYAVLDVPAVPRRRGVLFVVGGPQYRAGSHRQFTLTARSLAAQGYAAMRFDYRGMGDSEGEMRDFETVADDLRAAIDAFFAAVPGMQEVVLWGLCDAASAALLYAAGDPRVAGLALLNPWVRTDAGQARATLRHYYRSRLLDPGLWKKIATGRFALGAAAASFTRLLGKAASAPAGSADEGSALPARMAAGLARFNGPVLVMLSGADLTAQEFSDLCAAAPAWKRLMADPRVTRKMLPQADHTFSQRAWHDQVAQWSCEWMGSW